MVNMTPPKNTKEVHSFIGIFNYYRDMWERWSQVIHTLTALNLNNVKFKWTDVEHESFYDIKRDVTQDALLAYLDLNKRFDIHTDARDYYLGAVTSQEGRPIAFYSHKLTDWKHNTQ